MKVLITGANGFVGKNLKLFLKERSDIEIFSFSNMPVPKILNIFSISGKIIFKD